MLYTVTRQNSWGVDLPLAVEVSEGGLDYSNPDALSRKYPGEMQEYDSATKAVKAAIAIRKLWRQDEPEETIRLDCGDACCGSLPLADNMTDKDALDWATAHDKQVEAHEV